MKQGADLVHYGDGVFFALKGNKTSQFLRCIPTAVSAAPTADDRSGVMAGESGVQGLSLVVSPNPISSGFVAVRYNLLKAGPATVTVYDVTGRAACQQAIMAGRSGTATLDLRKLASGVYLVRLDADICSTTQKLIVQH